MCISGVRNVSFSENYAYVINDEWSHRYAAKKLKQRLFEIPL